GDPPRSDSCRADMPSFHSPARPYLLSSLNSEESAPRGHDEVHWLATVSVGRRAGRHYRGGIPVLTCGSMIRSVRGALDARGPGERAPRRHLLVLGLVRSRLEYFVPRGRDH